MVQAVLVQKASFDEAPDHLGGDASLLKIGKHPPLVCVGDGQGKGGFFLRLNRLGARGGRVPGAASIELQQIVHRLPEILAAELLPLGPPQNRRFCGERRSKGANAVFAIGGNGVERTLRRRDGVPASTVGVPFPGSPVLDADAVHLPGGVVPAAHPPDAVAQVFQQIRQVCPLGGSHLLVRETKGCVLFRVAHLLIQNAKQPGGYSDGSGYPPGCLFDVVLDCLTGPVICPAGFWSWEIAS